jgi:hypothetical protein
MIEVLPYLSYSYYEDEKSDKFYKRNKINCIIYLSKSQKRFKSSQFEEVVIDLDYDINHFDTNKINIRLYEYLYDLIEFIYKKTIIENNNVCILGFKNKQDIDAILMAYFIKYANINYQEAHHYIMSKKLCNYYDKTYYYNCLKKYMNQLQLINNIDY